MAWSVRMVLISKTLEAICRTTSCEFDFLINKNFYRDEEMKNKLTVSAVAGLLVAVLGTFVAQDAAAQGQIRYDHNGNIIEVGHHQPHMIPGGYHQHHMFPTPIVPMPGQRYPVYVSPNRISGINPFTGGLNTRNEQVDNTYFDYGRNQSQYNGTKRWVNRPIYDGYGNVTGYTQGYVWRNSFTGKESGNVRDVTNNGLGGQNETVRLYSTIDPSMQDK